MNIENKNIILTTLNSRFSHSSLSLRYLFANLKELKDEAKILEFVINSQNQTIVEEILEYKPKIVLISTYIWNAVQRLVIFLIELILKWQITLCLERVK